MTPAELRNELKKGSSEWNEKWAGTPVSDVVATHHMIMDLIGLHTWAIGRIIAMMEEKQP